MGKKPTVKRLQERQKNETRSRQAIGLDEKVKAIYAVEGGQTRKAVALKWCIPESTLRKWLVEPMRSKLINSINEGIEPNRAKLKDSKYSKYVKHIVCGLKTMNAQKTPSPVSYFTLKMEFAKAAAKDSSNAKLTDGTLNRALRTHQLTRKSMCGTSAAAPNTDVFEEGILRPKLAE